MKLRRWHRVGIVISVLWVLLAGLYERNKQVDNATSHAMVMGRVCLDANQKPVAGCLDEQSAILRDALKPNLENIAVVAFAPVLAGWVLVFLGLSVLSWIRAGEP